MALVVHFVAYLLAAFGLAFVAGHSEISVQLRDWIHKRGRVGYWLVKMIECPACLGFHIGWIYALAVRPDFLIIEPWKAAALLAFSTSGSNFVLGRITGLIEDD